MRQSQLFTKTRKDAPKDEVSKNAELLIRAGYIHKEMAGVYSFLPLGLRVLKNIEQVVREEMNRIGGQEVFLATLQDKVLWEKTGRWDDKIVDNWFKTSLKSGKELGLGLSHEEPLTNILSEYVSSFRELPLFVYQFQTKFRNELRAKSGIMRGREFQMKDMYSFARTQEEHDMLFAKARDAYKKVYSRLGIGNFTYATEASGGVFSNKKSEEFQTVSDAGEDTIYITPETSMGVIAANEEIFTDEFLKEHNLKKEDLIQKKSIEVGNIFHLDTKYSDALGLKFKDDSGKEATVIMGCYGIGLSRVMGAITEVLADEKGIVWPENVAPFKFHLISLAGEDEKVRGEADALYEKLAGAGIESLYDDRSARAGEKFADADLIGIPWRGVVSAKTIEKGIIELKNRATGEVTEITTDDLIKKLK